MTTPLVDGQWLDFYALLDVPVNADEDTIRKRIGKVYAEASANSDHRDFSRRSYYQALVERVLPQCRRVLLDPEWRAKYDRQHILHGIGDPSAQDYVSFIASMRGGEAALAGAMNPDANLPQRVQDEINLARQVVETAQAGAQLELLPSRAVKIRSEVETEPTAAKPAPAPVKVQRPQVAATQPVVAQPAAQPKPAPVARIEAKPQPAAPIEDDAAANAQFVTPRFEKAEATQQADVETIYQPGEPARAQTLTAQEAAAIRRRRNSNPDAEPYVDVSTVTPGTKTKVSRVTLEDSVSAPNMASRLVSPTSLNLMVAITGVLLTITIQKFAMTPAEATSAGRVPMVVVASPEIEPLVSSAANEWERTAEGAGYDVIVQSTDGSAALNRALGKNKSGIAPDAWIPSNSLWAVQYNRDAIGQRGSIAQTPMVLIARSDAAGALRRQFPNHQISSWNALRTAVVQNIPGGFGLADPQTSSSGAAARISMAREWGESHNMNAAQAAKSPQFWSWMSGFEDNIPSAGAFSSASMVKGMAQRTSDRYKWVIGYESDAIGWKKNEKTALEIFYLPRTVMADYPFCNIDRVGAPLEVTTGRGKFENYLHSDAVQKTLQNSGFRPTEAVKNTKDNPFASVRALPRDEKLKFASISALTSAWSRRY